MHRAGTSALARVCSMRGADLPRQLLPANEGNLGGYWEPAGVVALNDRILDYYDLAWDDPFAGSRLPSPERIPASFHAEARQVIQSEYGDSPLFVLKDPRCTLLCAFWIDVLQSLGVRACPVVMMRPGDEVLDSLVRRDHTSATSAGLLYVAYGLAAAGAAGQGASFVTYGQLIDNWLECTDRIASEQQFAWPPVEADVAAGVEAYLQPSTRVGQPAALPAPVAAWAEAVWSWCRDRAAGLARPEAELDAARTGLAAVAQTCAPLLLDRARRQRETDALRESALIERDAVLRTYRQTDALLHSTRADYEAQLAVLDAELRQARVDYEAQLAVVDAELRQARLDYEARLADDRVELQQTRTDYEARLVEADAELHQTRTNYEARLADLNAELRQTQADYQERDQECIGLRAGHDAMRAALDLAFLEADELRRELTTMLDSRSWKLTRPLRAAMRRMHGQHPADPDFLRLSTVAAERLDTHAAQDSAAQPHAGVLSRPHACLRDFLVAEFDETVAADVVLRIDRFRLPTPAAEARAASRVTCTEQEAVAWVQDIARRAGQRPEPGPEPDVSIVVPVYNQLPFTLACIDALIAHQTRYTFEVLVGDDASNDATEIALATPIRGVRHVRHPQNLGFVRNCNETARHARGRYVLFLNNDTLVLPGWLDELVGLLDADPGIGLVGSKLIYPDGRLQECGAIVWRDGSAWNYGRLDDPRRPEYGYLRDVDYVSGASIALSRQLWLELGGFDELFVPAYAEDADLAFRVRAAGLRTVVQPLSQLLHFEGISSGTDLGSGAKAYQVENLRKLHDRWKDVLAGHRPNAEHPALEKERAVARRLLFVDHCTPTPDEDAGSVVAFEVMRAFLGQGYKVTFIPEDNFAHVGGPTRDLQRIGIEAIYHPAYSTMAAFLSRRHDPFDVIFLHRFGVGDKHLDALRRKFPAARVIFLNADMHYLRELREAELNGDAAAVASAMRTKESELRVIAKADVALVHSAFEHELLQRELPGTEVALFPLIHDPVDDPPALSGREGICFVGGFRHPPNADGIAWFVDAVWPLVLASAPGARLRIAGSHVTPEVQALAARRGVEVVGFVGDLAAFLGRHRVNVAPLRYGAGAKGKVAASIAHGLPVVCTPVAAEGMQLTPGIDVLVGDGAEELAGHVLALLNDDGLWHRLSEAGLAHARNVTSRASASARIRSLLPGSPRRQEARGR
jgi:GT2 family glycosyltransferase